MKKKREKKPSKKTFVHHYIVISSDAPKKLRDTIRETGKRPYVIAEDENQVLVTVGEHELTCPKKCIKNRVRRKGNYQSMKLHSWTPEANTRLMQRFHARDFKGMTRAERTQINKWILRRHRMGKQGATMLGEYREHEPFGETDLYCLATVQTDDGIKNKANTISHLAAVMGRPEQQVMYWVFAIKAGLAESGLGILAPNDITPKMLRDFAFPQSADLRQIIGKFPDGPKPPKE